MEAVGYDLYCKMLNESVKELKGETQPEEEFDTVIDLDIDAFIPERYIKNEFQKLDVYKRIATIESEEEYDDMLEELMDRFGEPPKAVQNLLAVANLKPNFSVLLSYIRVKEVMFHSYVPSLNIPESVSIVNFLVS